MHGTRCSLPWRMSGFCRPGHERRIDDLNAAYDDLTGVKGFLTMRLSLRPYRPSVRRYSVVDARQNLTAELNCPQQ